MTAVLLLAALFWAAFLAATILPVGSEPALSAALLTGLPPLLCIAVASVGNILGSLTTYLLGRLGRTDWLVRLCRTDEAAVLRLRERIGRWGAPAAFAVFLPGIGDGLAVALGYMRYPFFRFLLFMGIGKILRYILWWYLHKTLLEGR